MELPDLYAAVPAAEEEDLLEEVARERGSAEPPDADEQPAAEDAPDAPADPEPGFPLPQVLGLLEHRLGAQVLPPEPPPSG